jgi:hypothetical protein
MIRIFSGQVGRGDNCAAAQSTRHKKASDGAGLVQIDLYWCNCGLAGWRGLDGLDQLVLIKADDLHA